MASGGYGRGGRGAAQLQALNQLANKPGGNGQPEEGEKTHPTVAAAPLAMAAPVGVSRGRGALLASVLSRQAQQAQQPTPGGDAPALVPRTIGRGLASLKQQGQSVAQTTARGAAFLSQRGETLVAPHPPSPPSQTRSPATQQCPGRPEIQASPPGDADSMGREDTGGPPTSRLARMSLTRAAPVHMSGEAGKRYGTDNSMSDDITEESTSNRLESENTRVESSNEHAENSNNTNGSGFGSVNDSNVRLHSKPLHICLGVADLRRNIETNVVQRISTNDNGATSWKPSKVATEMCIIPPKKNVLHPEYNSTVLVESKSTEYFKDDNCENNASNTMPVQEKCFNDDRKVTVCIVKPLKSLDPELCKKDTAVQCKAKGFDVRQLDWNKIFMFLVRKVKPDEWRIFANILLGGVSSKMPVHESVDCKVARIKAENKNFYEMVLECLNYWKQLMANDACPCHIEGASKETGWNDVVQDFIDFMSVPPMLASVNQNWERVEPKKLATGGPTFPQIYMNPGHMQFGCFPLPLTSTINSSGPVIEEIEERSVCSSGLELMKSNQRKQTSSLSGEECVTEVRKCKVKKSSKSEQCQTFKRSKCTKHRTKRFKPNKKHRLKQCIVDLIVNPPSSSRPLEKLPYNIFMKYTIKSIMLKTKESRKTILSLKYVDYCDVEKFETKRQDTFYVIYSENKQLTLGEKEYEKLKFYVENARQTRIEQLKGSASGRFIEPEELFLDYKGEPTLTKNLLIRRRRLTANSSSSCTEISDSDLSSPMEEKQSQLRDSADESFDSSTDSEVVCTDDNVSGGINRRIEGKQQEQSFHGRV